MLKDKDKDTSRAGSSDTHLLIGSYAELLQIIGLTGAYFITGTLGIFLAIPPGYATAIWPPSGIALAGILIYGYRVWPGILLGSFLVNGVVPGLTGFVFESLPSLLIGLVISLGASLQALIGAYWVRRYAGFPNALKREKEVLLFLLYGGLLSALVNSTLSVSTLVVMGRIPTANFLSNWGTWWAGDVLGVFIFTPLVLIWMLQTHDVWKNRRLAITLPTLLMFTLTTSAVFYEEKSSYQRIKLDFDQRAVELKTALETSVVRHTNVLRFIGGLYASSTLVTRQEFRIFVTQSLGDFHGIQALEWSPLIQASEREAFEQGFQQDGYPNFQITERDDTVKTMVRAKNRPKYVPITFLEPYEGNEKALGYDFLSSEERQQALDRATDTDDLAITARVVLVQEKESQQGLVAFLPIYRNDLPHQTLEQRRHAISGYAVGIFRVGDVVTNALNGLNTQGLSYRLIDQSAPAAEQLLFFNTVIDPLPLIIQEKSLFSAKKSLTSHLVFPIGGRVWRLEVAPTEGYFSANAWLILLAGLVLTSLVELVALVASGRARMLQQLVGERTAELERQYGIYCSVIQNTGEGVWRVGGEGQLLEVNTAYLNLTGYSKAELLGMQVTDLETENAASQLLNIIDCTKINKFETKHCCKDGRVLNIEINKFFTKENDGGFVAFIKDITAQKQVENEKDAAHVRLELILNSTGEGIYGIGLDGVCIFANRAAITMLGYATPEDILGENNHQLFHYAHADGSAYELNECPIYNALRGHPSTTVDSEVFWRKDGTSISIQYQSHPIKIGDQIFGCVVNFTDITERKQNEAIVLLAKDRAEDLARSKSEFLANMSHEIRTPMNAIIGLSQLLLNKNISFEVRDYLEKIYCCSNSLLSILNDILDFSKLEAGRLTIEFAVFDLDTLLSNLSNLFAVHAEEKHLAFNIEVKSDVPRNLVGDTSRLQQVLINLLGNAIKFTEQGSVTLTISTKQIDQTQVRLIFCVTDTGIGMSDSDREKLFFPFSQVDGSITRRFGGTGLGLAISHNLVQLMGGEILVVSSPDQGSHFSFELLLGVSSSRSKPAPHRSALRDNKLLLAGARVLVAEDNLINQQVVCEFLTLSGISVELAANGKEALELLALGKFDAVLMDIHMPVLDGFEATQLIRSKTCYAALPIIALTAGVTKEEQEKCMAIGMSDFIAKPIDPKKLMSTLVHWIKPAEDVTIDETKTVYPPETQVVPILDLQNLLAMLNNNQQLVTQLLLDFMINMDDFPNQIIGLVRIGDKALARELAHKIKGAAGNIGAMRLHSAAEILEVGLNGELSAETFHSFNQAFIQTISVIAAMQHPKDLLSTNGNSEALKQGVAELDFLLKGNDFISEALLNTLKPHLTAAQLDLFAELRKLINNLNYDQARTILRQLTDQEI